MPRRNDEAVVIQVFFLESRIVGSEARVSTTRGSDWAMGCEVRDDNVEDFALLSWPLRQTTDSD